MYRVPSNPPSTFFLVAAFFLPCICRELGTGSVTHHQYRVILPYRLLCSIIKSHIYSSALSAALASLQVQDLGAENKLSSGSHMSPCGLQQTGYRQTIPYTISPICLVPWCRWQRGHPSVHAGRGVCTRRRGFHWRWVAISWAAIGR